MGMPTLTIKIKQLILLIFIFFSELPMTRLGLAMLSKNDKCHVSG